MASKSRAQASNSRSTTHPPICTSPRVRNRSMEINQSQLRSVRGLRLALEARSPEWPMSTTGVKAMWRMSLIMRSLQLSRKSSRTIVLPHSYLGCNLLRWTLRNAWLLTMSTSSRNWNWKLWRAWRQSFFRWGTSINARRSAHPDGCARKPPLDKVEGLEWDQEQ